MKNDSSEIILDKLFRVLYRKDDVTAKELLNKSNCNEKLGTLEKTPLHFTAKNKSIELTRYLLDELKANPNKQDQLGQTPLHFAAKNGDIEMIKLLLLYGANPETQDHCFDTPKKILQSKGFNRIFKEVEVFIAEQKKKQKENLLPNPPSPERFVTSASSSSTSSKVFRSYPLEQNSGSNVIGTVTNFFKSFLPASSSAEDKEVAKQPLLTKEKTQ